MSTKYRNRPTHDYTVVRNAALRNPELSLKAKGCLALMLTFPDDWEYHLTHLEGMSRDGRDGLRAAIRELEKHGYISRQQTRRPDGTLGDSEYHVTDDRREATVDGKTGDGKPVDGADADQDAMPTADAFTGDGLTVDGKTVDGKPATTKTELTKTEEPKTSTREKKPKKQIVHEFNPHAVELPPQFDPERFVAFCDMRLAIAKPMSVQALKAFVTKHKKHSREVLDEAFDSAIVASWQDLYPPKDARGKPPSPALDQYTERGL